MPVAVQVLFTFLGNLFSGIVFMLLVTVYVTGLCDVP